VVASFKMKNLKILMSLRKDQYATIKLFKQLKPRLFDLSLYTKIRSFSTTAKKLQRRRESKRQGRQGARVRRICILAAGVELGGPHTSGDFLMAYLLALRDIICSTRSSGGASCAHSRLRALFREAGKAVSISISPGDEFTRYRRNVNQKENLNNESERERDFSLSLSR
jgi:hypothetical protein